MHHTVNLVESGQHYRIWQ